MEPNAAVMALLDHLDRDVAAGRLPPYLRRALGRFRELPWREQRAQLAGLYLSLEEYLADVSIERRHSRSHLRSIVRSRFRAVLDIPELALLLAEPEEQERRLGELLRERLRAETKGALNGGAGGASRAEVEEIHRMLEASLGSLQAARLFDSVVAGLARSHPGLEPALWEIVPERLLDQERAGALAARRREQGWRERFEALRRVNDELAARLSEVERERAELLASQSSSVESATLLGAVFDTAGEGILTVDRHGVILRANRAALALWGYADTEVVGKDIGLLLAGGARPGQSEALRRYLGSGTPGVFGERVVLDGRRRDGTTFSARLRATETKIGPRVVFTLVIRDLTELRQAEARIRLQAAALQSSAGGIAIADPLGRIEWTNPSFDAMTGYAAGELHGRTLAETCGLEDELPHVSWRGERGVMRKDGSSYLASVVVSPVRDEAERILHLVIHHDDITAEKAGQEALARSEASYRALIEQSPDAIVVARFGTIVFVNPAAAAALGAGLVGRPLSAIGAEEGRFSAREMVLTRTDGGTLDVEIVGLSSMFDGAPAEVLIARDITERKRLQARLAVADRMLALGTLAAGVAHEINNPLASVMLNLEALENGLRRQDPEAGASMERLALQAREAFEGAERVRLIVRDLQTFARDEPTRANYLVDVQRMLDAAAQLAVTEIRSRARLIKAYGPTPLVLATETRLGQVFLNLILNAVQAIPPGQPEWQTIEIATRTAADGRAEVEIRDSGMGVPSELQSRVFDPFFTTKRVGEGMGLGLSITHNIVVALGGEIDLESEVGAGTTVRVRLPAAGRKA